MTGPRAAGAPEVPPSASTRPAAAHRAAPAANPSATNAVGTEGVAGAAAARDDLAKDDGPARRRARDASPESGAANDEGTKTRGPHAHASTTGAPDPQAHEPTIPDDVATGLEELPPDFWDEPPAAPRAPSNHAPVNRARPAQEPRRGPAASPGPRRGASEEPAHASVSGSSDRGATQHGGLERALLGGDTTAGELPDALRDTVHALQELFPGELLAVAPRADEDDGVVGAAADDDGGPGDGDGEDDDGDGTGDTTHERTDAG